MVQCPVRLVVLPAASLQPQAVRHCGHQLAGVERHPLQIAGPYDTGEILRSARLARMGIGECAFTQAGIVTAETIHAPGIQRLRLIPSSFFA